MYNLNIATFKVERRERGGEAIMVLESDDIVPDHLAEAIADFPWVHWVRHIARLAS